MFWFLKTAAENFLQAKIPFGRPMYKNKSRDVSIVGKRRKEVRNGDKTSTACPEILEEAPQKP